MSRNAAYDWREDDKLFAASWDKAMRRGVSALEDEASRRGFEGVGEPLVHQGQVTYEYERDEHGEIIYDEYVVSTTESGDQIRAKRPRLLLDENRKPVAATVRKYSDTLAIFLLKAHDPEKYRERSDVKVQGNLDVAATIYEARKRARKAESDRPLTAEDLL
jgi:hypothetical protein